MDGCLFIFANVRLSKCLFMAYSGVMKRRLIISIIAALVYTATYAGILTWQGEELRQVDLLIGAIVFAVTFYIVRTWLDKRRYRKEQTPNQPEEESESR